MEGQRMIDLREVETREELIEWLAEWMPGASLHELDDELIIHTGLTYIMGGVLQPIGEESE
jgi:hypothetical protein